MAEKQQNPLIGFRRVFKEKDLKGRDKLKAYISNEEAYALAKALAAHKAGENGVVLDMRFEAKDNTNPNILTGFAIVSEGGNTKAAGNFKKTPVAENTAVASAMAELNQQASVVKDEL